MVRDHMTANYISQSHKSTHRDLWKLMMSVFFPFPYKINANGAATAFGLAKICKRYPKLHQISVIFLNWKTMLMTRCEFWFDELNPLSIFHRVTMTYVFLVVTRNSNVRVIRANCLWNPYLIQERTKALLVSQSSKSSKSAFCCGIYHPRNQTSSLRSMPSSNLQTIYCRLVVWAEAEKSMSLYYRWKTSRKAIFSGLEFWFAISRLQPQPKSLRYHLFISPWYVLKRDKNE